MLERFLYRESVSKKEKIVSSINMPLLKQSKVSE